MERTDPRKAWPDPSFTHTTLCPRCLRNATSELCIMLRPEIRSLTKYFCQFSALGIAEGMEPSPRALTGGEQRRLVANRARDREFPRDSLANGPTGDLGGENSAAVLKRIRDLSRP